MLSKLKLYISSDDFEITYHITSLLHGVIMSIIAPEYAEFLHSGGLNPYSISLKKEADSWCWTIATVGKEAYENITKVLLDDSFTTFTLIYKNNAVVRIDKKVLCTENANNLFNCYTFDNNSNIIKVEFSSPTAFKSNGQYVFFPDLFLIYQSLMKKSQLIADDISFDDNDTLKALTENSHIISYNLKTVNYHLEGRKITGFVGNITIRINGPTILKNFAEALFKAGSYLGIGIKASLGMGSLSLVKKKEGVSVE